jgi:competence protein ComGC
VISRGVVVKDATAVTNRGSAGWVKIKNGEYWRYELEHEAAIEMRRLPH